MIENETLAIWGCDKTIKIWNLSLRQNAMDSFKRTATQFVEVNQSHIMATEQFIVHPEAHSYLEGTDFIQDSVARLTSTLLSKKHFRTISYSSGIVKIFVASSIQSDNSSRTYLVCNLAALNTSDVPSIRFSTPHSDFTTTGPQIHISDLNTDEFIRQCSGIALFAGALPGTSNIL